MVDDEKALNIIHKIGKMVLDDFVEDEVKEPAIKEIADHFPIVKQIKSDVRHFIDGERRRARGLR